MHADVDTEHADDCQQERQVGPETAGLKSVDSERDDTESGHEEQRSDEDAVLLVAVLDGVIQHAGHVDTSLQPALAKDGTEHISSKGIDRTYGMRLNGIYTIKVRYLQATTAFKCVR